MADEFTFFSRKDLTPEDIYGSSQLDQITTRHFSWVYDTAAYSLGWQWWGVHLLERWSDLPYLIAPPDYDRGYYSRKGQNRADWLAELRWICNNIFAGTIAQDFDGHDECYPLTINLNEKFNGIKEDLYKAIMRGLCNLNVWLSWREKSAVEQVLEALPIIHTDVRDNVVVVDRILPDAGNQFFHFLFEEFQSQLSADRLSDSTLRIVYNQFLTQSKLVVPSTLTSVAALPDALPSLHWPNLSELTALSLSPAFRDDLEAVLTVRIEWANRASKVLGDALGGTILPVQHKKTSDNVFTMKQVAMLRYYTKQAITEINKSVVAASAGFEGTTSGVRLMEKSTEWLEQVVSELPESRKQLTAIKKDLVAILPELPDKAHDEVHRLLKKIAKKYKGGF